MARSLAAGILVALLCVSGAGGSNAQTPKRGGTVVVAYAGPDVPPSCVIPRYVEPTCPNHFLTDLIHPVLAGNLKVRPEGWSPNLVSRFTLTTRDPFAVTLHIHPEARWSDGRPVTAADFVSSDRIFRRLFPLDRYMWAEARRVSAIDAKTLRLEWDRPRDIWLRQVGLFPVVPRHVLRGENLSEVWAHAIVNPKTGKPIASGPFLLQSFRPGRHVVFVRNPRYWGPHPAYVDRVVIRFGANSADALRRGDVDVVGGGGRDVAAASEFVERPERGIAVISGPGDGWEHLDIRVGRGGHPALTSKIVRRALAYGIDREAIVHALWGRIAPGLGVLDSTSFFTNERGYEPNWGRYRHQPTEARRLLEQAGCRRGADGIYVCAGQRLRLRFLTSGGVPHRERTLELIQAQLASVGVEVVPVYAASLAVLAAGDFDVALFAWPKSVGELGNYQYGCGSPVNYTGYCSRLFTADVDQLQRIVDPTRQRAVANAADRRLARDVPVIPLYQLPKLYAFRESIKGIRPNPFWAVWWNAEEWWLER